MDLATGHRSFVREVAPGNRAGVVQTQGIALADDGKSYAYAYAYAYAYSYAQYISKLMVIEGGR